MTEKWEEFNESLLLPVALVGLIAGIVSIIKDTPWFVFLPIITASALLIFFYYYKRNKYSHFDVLSRNEIIDLVDTKGKLAYYTNNCLFKSLKRNASSVKFLVESSGKVKKHKINSGVIENVNEESGTTTFKISTPKPIAKGDNYNGILQCELVNTFRNDKEYWDVKKFSKGINIKLTIIFPNDRKPTTYIAYKINGHNKTASKQQPKLIIENTRTALLFEVKKMTHFENYRVEWQW